MQASLLVEPQGSWGDVHFQLEVEFNYSFYGSINQALALLGTDALEDTSS